jgi:CHAT domain-containing protein
LDYVLRVFEKNRGRILEKQNRDSFFDAEQSIYDIGIDYAFKKGDKVKAFWFSETSRARSLLDAVHGQGSVVGSGDQADLGFSSATQPLDLDSVRSRLPEGLRLVQYNVLKDRLLIWTISREKYEVVEKAISADELNREVADYVTLLTENSLSRDEIVKQQAAHLYQLLITPIDKNLVGAKEVCFIPDKALFYLPFSSLVAPVGDYLIAHHLILFSPSATLTVLWSDQARAKLPEQSESILSVGNPSFDARAYPDMPLLPAAEREAAEVAQNYERRIVLTGSRARKESVISLLHEAEVVHLACHYIPDESSPMNSKLLLASKPESEQVTDGTLSAGEIFTRKMPKAKLVVLSGCQTGLERYFNGEGMVGLSEAFIAAGAPLVIASQWAVDSDATAELMSNFHRHRKLDHLDTVTALQEAQMDLMNGSVPRYRRPYYWAAFLPIGGYATY